MANMGYCRFSNTLDALQDCISELSVMESLKDLSDFEQKAAEDIRGILEGYITNYDKLEECE